MKVVQLKKRKINIEDFKLRAVSEQDYKQIIDKDSILMEGDTVKAVYLNCNHEDLKQAEVACRSIKYNTSDRSQGLVSTSRVFGYLPRIKHRKDYCTASGLAYEDPLNHAKLAKIGELADQYYKQYIPATYANHEKEMQQVLDFYKIPNTLFTRFTSGIINKTTQLKYHFDAGNFKNVASAMFVFKRGLEGGYLAFPEYNLALACNHNSLSIFDGQSILHGVTAFKRKFKDESLSYRYSLVFYSMQQMTHCLIPEQELQRIRKNKTERELKRVKVSKLEYIKQYNKSFYDYLEKRNLLTALDNGEVNLEALLKEFKQ